MGFFGLGGVGHGGHRRKRLVLLELAHLGASQKEREGRGGGRRSRRGKVEISLQPLLSPVLRVFRSLSLNVSPSEHCGQREILVLLPGKRRAFDSALFSKKKGTI